LFVQGGTHSSFLKGSSNFDFSSEILSSGADPSLARSYLKSLSLAFFQTYLNQQSSYGAYLNESSVRAMSQPSLPVYLLQTLTEEQLQQATRASN
jgi:predicted dienelactone hydrolase